MFARKVSVCLKPTKLKIFTRLMEGELLPWLQTQEGFLDLITLAGPDGIEVQVISFWDHQANAEACNAGYPAGVLKTLETLLDGIASAKTFEVVSSTLDRFAPPKSMETESAVTGVDRPNTGRPHPGYGSYETNA